MITEIPLLQNVRVASPCDASWDEMAQIDGDRVRFCDGCRKRVYNLSALGQAEAEGLLRAHEGHLCVRYYRRRDGTILTTDCPVGLAAARRLVLTRVRASVRLCALLCVALAANQALQPAAHGDTAEPPATKVDKPLQPLMGVIAVTPVPTKPTPPKPAAHHGQAFMGKPAIPPTGKAECVEVGQVSVRPQ